MTHTPWLTHPAGAPHEELPKWRGPSRAPIKWFPRVTGLWVRLVFNSFISAAPGVQYWHRGLCHSPGGSSSLVFTAGDAAGRQLPRCKSEVEGPSAFTPRVTRIPGEEEEEGGGKQPALTHSSRYSSHQKYTVVPPSLLANWPRCILPLLHLRQPYLKNTLHLNRVQFKSVLVCQLIS